MTVVSMWVLILHFYWPCITKNCIVKAEQLNSAIFSAVAICAVCDTATIPPDIFNWPLFLPKNDNNMWRRHSWHWNSSLQTFLQPQKVQLLCSICLIRRVCLKKKEIHTSSKAHVSRTRYTICSITKKGKNFHFITVLRECWKMHYIKAAGVSPNFWNSNHSGGSENGTFWLEWNGKWYSIRYTLVSRHI